MTESKGVGWWRSAMAVVVEAVYGRWEWEARKAISGVKRGSPGRAVQAGKRGKRLKYELCTHLFVQNQSAPHPGSDSTSPSPRDVDTQHGCLVTRSQRQLYNITGWAHGSINDSQTRQMQKPHIYQHVTMFYCINISWDTYLPLLPQRPLVVSSRNFLFLVCMFQQ